MWQLRSPLWKDTDLPAINQDLADQGRADFEQFCLRCHQDIDRDDPNRRIDAVMTPVKHPNDPDAVGTDEAMAKNFLTKSSRARQLTRRFVRYLAIASKLKRFERKDRDNTPNAEILGYAVVGAITHQLRENPIETLNALKAGQTQDVVEIIEKVERKLTDTASKAKILEFVFDLFAKLKLPEMDPDKLECAPDGKLLCYKARPLNGIWATAPYLHNGSVRTMRQLLLPAGERETKFKVGTREFDPKDMGFKNEGSFTLDTALDGNSNKGHDGPTYGNEMFKNDPDRMNALLEYLKTL